MSDPGKTTWQDDRATVHFERWFDAPIDSVWTAITSPQGLEAWLSAATVDLRIGGEIDLDFGESGLAGGAIIDLAPGESVEFEWQFPGEDPSVVRFDLRSENGGTRFTLNHRLLPGDQATGYGAGWHAHLDQLDEVLAHRAVSDWDARFQELLPLYQSG